MVHEHALRIAVVGLRTQEVDRLEQKLKKLMLSVQIIDGGHISDGSNACRHAIDACDGADLVLWQPEGARHLPKGFVPENPVVYIQGVSSAVRAVCSYLGRPGKDAAQSA